MSSKASSPPIDDNASRKELRRQQFTGKQRMDMYAFCVLELEMHSNKVSIKKQQQAIQKVLNERQKGQTQQPARQQQQQQVNLIPSSSRIEEHVQVAFNETKKQDLQQEAMTVNSQQIPASNSQHGQAELVALEARVQIAIMTSENHQEPQQQSQQQLAICRKNSSVQSSNHDECDTNTQAMESKTLLQLQEEVAMTRTCYSDYQKTLVLTSSMLRDVQKRFSKYYPDSAIPSRSTIKHVFEKCVIYGTVENIKTPRKATKIPHGDEIEYLLIHEPQLSLRQMAQKLNVSTGTVSRRCKALGLVPESVTIKHQQLATARRAKQIKLESQSRGDL